MSEPFAKLPSAMGRALRWFNAHHWALRYFVICGVLYGPGPLLAWYAGTLTAAQHTTIEVPFVRDSVFQYTFLLAVPYTLLMLPLCFGNMDRVLDEFVESRLLKPEEKALSMRKCVIWGLSVSTVLVCGIAVANVHSMLKQDRTALYWWFPSGRGWLAFLYLLAACLVYSFISVASCARYMATMRKIKHTVEEADHIPIWIGSPDGPVDRLFRSLFLLLLPGGGISLLIVRNRLLLGTEWDLVLYFNVFIVPIMLALILVHPIYYSGLLAKFHQQRAAMLRACDRTMASFFAELSTCGEMDKRRTLYEQIECCSKEKELIAKNHPVWPIGFVTKLLPMIPLTLSLVPTAKVTIELVAELLFQGPTAP